MAADRERAPRGLEQPIQAAFHEICGPIIVLVWVKGFIPGSRSNADLLDLDCYDLECSLRIASRSQSLQLANKHSAYARPSCSTDLRRITLEESKPSIRFSIVDNLPKTYETELQECHILRLRPFSRSPRANESALRGDCDENNL
ncbi:hypothetical protein A0H81_05006 [Grifola frondosa]|uniref:Uncharacterized protein n=1 Tax=Grifola frondosa TaxID=5627 RepID=A0A1C7MFA8_GRIFR|nr:hypothetical protein A0H81_05006 [Grifola frondosa]